MGVDKNLLTVMRAASNSTNLNLALFTLSDKDSHNRSHHISSFR